MNNNRKTELFNSNEYKDFLAVNSGSGNLKIRAYAASEALPVSGLKIVVSTEIDNRKVIFFEGVTDASGMIDNIVLPAPKLDSSNLIVPNTITYLVEASSLKYNEKSFKINMYDGICVVQNINFVPGGIYGN